MLATKLYLEKAQLKWRDFHGNLYVGEEYTLLLEGGKEAVFLPGPAKEFFKLSRYKEEVLKDFKCITLFLCTLDDFRNSFKTSYKVETESSHNFEAPVNELNNVGDASDSSEEPPTKKYTTMTNHPTVRDEPGPSGLNTSTAVSNSADFDSGFYCDEIDQTYSVVDSPPQSRSSAKPTPNPENEADIIQMLEEKVITDGKTSMFIIIRQGAPVSRAIILWKRASLKVNPVHVCHVKFLGEDGIDDGALSCQFFASTVADIGRKFSLMEAQYIPPMTLLVLGQLERLHQQAWPREAHPQAFLLPVCMTLLCQEIS